MAAYNRSHLAHQEAILQRVIGVIDLPSDGPRAADDWPRSYRIDGMKSIVRRKRTLTLLSTGCLTLPVMRAPFAHPQ